MLFLLRDVEQNKQDIATLKEQLAETNQLVRQLAFEIQRVSEREQHEREKFFLKVENALLRFERQLPSGKGPKKLK
jgi:predicted  nucleic acid-binding Zn-ribbon protein